MVELYAFQALRTLIKLKWVVSYQVISVLVLYIIYSFLQFDRSVGQTTDTLYDGLVLLVYVPKC
jgi:hypothetical protein